MEKRTRELTKFFRTTPEERDMFHKKKNKFGYHKNKPTIEIILDLFEKIELQELEIYQLKSEIKKTEELEKQNKIVNSKINLNTKLLQELLNISDKELEEIKIKLIRKNNNK